MRLIVEELLMLINGSFAGSILLKVTIVTALALTGAQLARRSRAAVRHLLLAASFGVVIVLPMASILVQPIQITLPVAMSSRKAEPASESFTAATVPVTANVRTVWTPSTEQTTKLSPWSLLLPAWMVGALLFLVPVAAGLWQIRMLRRSGLPWQHGRSVLETVANDAGVHRRIDVLLHESVSGPMTFGIARPVILLPVDAQVWPPEALRRAIVHEFEHVRRGDWITRCLARAVCAVYWFHPFVWLSWRHLVLEAERACDDAVLERAAATVYADQLVVLAQRFLSKPEHGLLAMASRHDLARRVSALLDDRQQRGRAGAFCVFLACTASLLAVTVISPLHVVAGAQKSATGSPAPPSQKFEVASVKPCKEEDFSVGTQRRTEFTVSPGRVTVNCRPVERIIYFAYAGIGSMENPLLNDDHAVNSDHVRGGPSWVRSESFVIEGKAEGNPDRTLMMGPMLRAVLEEQFHLKTHRELEEVPMYAMTVAKGGLKIKPINEGDCASVDSVSALSPEERMRRLNSIANPVCGSFSALGNGVLNKWTLGGETLGKFANQTLSGVLDRFVMDKTGMLGIFNIHLEFGPDENVRAGVFGGRPSQAFSAENPVPAGVEKGPSIFAALEEQLGLKLEKTRGPREFLVIDSVEKPTGK